ncbi:MAG: hypothetical protein F2670_03580 [Actinobacteria bacterium]|uniref:Unannotated protein n=1 Tax=freshwater metagenome TaxID=449393 RepID=A0A6J6PSL3_9ZZZZ|nr:hypothetical protein [Actinomycetota bacterium]
MKRVLVFLLALFFAIPIQSANAAEVVSITEPTHRLIDGKFFDDVLATKLLPSGELGDLVFTTSRSNRSWLIDPATISEITAMSNGYGVIDGSTPTGQQIAKDWLTQFYRITKYEKVSAITYGNPAKSWVSKLMPADVEYLNAISKIKLEEYLGKASPGTVTTSTEKQKLSNSIQNTFIFADKQFKLMSTLVDPKEFDLLKLRMAQLLNPQISAGGLTPLYADFQSEFNKVRNQLRVSKSKFTVTSSKQELPITVVNDFNSPVKIKLTTRAINSKVVVRPTEAIEIPAKSKLQVLLPIEVLASGNSSLLTQLTNLDNKPIGFPVYISLKLSVISPVATWITSGAAVVLLIAAIIQSVRRFRRGKHER